MNLMLRPRKLIGPFWSQLILLAAGLLLTTLPASAGPVFVIGQECNPAAFAATWSQATGTGPVLTSVTASTAVPGTYIVRGYGFSAGGAVEIATYDACGVDRHAQGRTVASIASHPLGGEPDPDAIWPVQAGLVVWTFTLGADGPMTVRAHDVETGAWTNAVLVAGAAEERADCDRECLRSRGIEATP